MVKQRSTRPGRQPAADAPPSSVNRLPGFGAEAALGPAARPYRTLPYAGLAARGGVLPSQMDDMADSVESGGEDDDGFAGVEVDAADVMSDDADDTGAGADDAAEEE